ncbi:hypothetical protein ACFLZH_05970 [Patescibacteria group bacterium]
MRSQETSPGSKPTVRMLGSLGLKPEHSAAPDDKAPADNSVQKIVRNARISEEVQAIMTDEQRGIKG